MCKIPRCSNPAVAHGLCAKHYMRQRRHGDPTVTHPPGVDLDAWRKKVATLERELARAQNPAKPSAPCAACAAKDRTLVTKDREIERLTAQLNGQQKPRSAGNEQLKAENERLKTENDELRKQAAAANGPSDLPRTAEELAQAKLRKQELDKAKRAAKRAANPEIPDEKTKEEYERLIKSLRTQLRNQTAKFREFDRLMLQAVANKAVFASAEDRRFVLGHFHPDRFKSGQKNQATRVFQLLNNIPVMDR